MYCFYLLIRIFTLKGFMFHLSLISTFYFNLFIYKNAFTKLISSINTLYTKHVPSSELKIQQIFFYKYY